MMNVWLAFGLIVLAAALDIAANILLAKSDGFRRKLLGFVSLFFVGLAFFCLSLAVKTLPLSVAYALWGALGILGTSLGGWLFFGQRLAPCAFVGMAFLITGIVLLRSS